MSAIGRAVAICIGSVLAGLPAAEAQTTAEPVPVPPICATSAGDGTPVVAFPSLVRAMTLRHRIVALAIGSSVMGGGWRRGDYYDLVERFLESTFKGLDLVIVQRGVSGELARDAADRIRLEAARSQPDVVFWQVGTADALAGLDPAEVGETVRDTVRWLRDHGIDVVLIGLHYSPTLSDDRQYQAVRDVINEVARSEGVLRIRRYEAGETLAGLQSRQSAGDGAEDLTALGNTCMAEHLARSLAAGLFARKAR